MTPNTPTSDLHDDVELLLEQLADTNRLDSTEEAFAALLTTAVHAGVDLSNLSPPDRRDVEALADHGRDRTGGRNRGPPQAEQLAETALTLDEAVEVERGAKTADDLLLERHGVDASEFVARPDGEQELLREVRRARAERRGRRGRGGGERR